MGQCVCVCQETIASLVATVEVRTERASMVSMRTVAIAILDCRRFMTVGLMHMEAATVSTR